MEEDFTKMVVSDQLESEENERASEIILWDCQK